jgi:predicted Rossmann-fold nucleotide-binding protein
MAQSLPEHAPSRKPDSRPLSVAWTGHRPEFFADAEAVAEAITARARALHGAHQGALAFHCGGQRGVDTWAARAAERLGIPLHLYLPLPVARFAVDWTTADRQALEQSWAYAIERVVTDSDGRLGADAYRQRNRLLAERCDLLIAMWTGLGGGGTAETIQFARGLGRQIEEHLFAPSGRAPHPGERGV